MVITELEVVAYDRRNSSRSSVIEKPIWQQIEDAIRILDRSKHPFLKLFLPLPTDERDLRELDIIGGRGEYGILTFDSKHRQLQWYCDPTRPDGPKRVPIWTSDQGAAFEERYLCNDLTTVLRVAEYFAMNGRLDPTVTWEDWPPSKHRPPEKPAKG